MAKRRIFIFFLMLALVSLTALLAACGGDKDKKEAPHLRPPKKPLRPFPLRNPPHPRA